MLNNKELNEKIKAFLNTKEKSNLRQTEILMKNAFSSDYLMYDVVNFISLIKDDQEFINYIGLENLENKVIETNNEVCIGALIDNIEGVNIQKLEDAVINMKNAFILFNFACITVNTNIEKLENAIIEAQNAKGIYKFARDVKGANIEKLENAIIATKLVKFMQEFAKNVKGANIEKLENAIIEINNPSLISFMRKVLDDKEMTDAEIQMAKRKYIFSLLDNIGEIDNGVMLGMCLGCFISPESTVEDLEKCNEAYLNYMSSREKEQTNNKKK